MVSSASAQPIFTYLERYGPLTPDDKAFLSQRAQRLILPKQRTVFAEGVVCQHMYFIASGLARTHYNKDGRDVTTGFAAEGVPVTALSSFLNRQPATYGLETLEPTVLYALTYDDLRALFSQSHTFENLSRLATVEALLAMEDRLYSLQFYSAHERYERFQKAFPHLTNRVSLTHLASYIGVSLETLSRIRANLTNIK